jgi:hypothetical protein
VKQNLQKSTTLTRWVESAVLFNAADDYTTRLLRSALNELKQGIPIREAALEVLLRVKNEMGQLKGAESS